jgi:hypothetical protein
VFSSEFEPFGDAGFVVEETVETDELGVSDLVGFGAEWKTVTIRTPATRA